MKSSEQNVFSHKSRNKFAVSEYTIEDFKRNFLGNFKIVNIIKTNEVKH